QRGGGRRAGNAYGDGEWGGDQPEPAQAWSPDSATAGFRVALVELGERGGGLGALVVRSVHAQAPRGPALGAQADSSTRPPARVPGPLAGAPQPGQSGPRRAAEAGTCQACPTAGVGAQHGGATKCQPGPRPGGHAVARMRGAQRRVNGGATGPPTGGRLAKHP